MHGDSCHEQATAPAADPTRSTMAVR